MTTATDKKNVYICLSYTNMFYIRNVIEHVKTFCKLYNYRVVDNAGDASLCIDVYVRIVKNQFQIVNNDY